MNIKILMDHAMINIHNKDNLDYANVRDMYTSGHGHGLQVSEELEPKREQIETLCDRIADLLYELGDMLEIENPAEAEIWEE